MDSQSDVGQVPLCTITLPWAIDLDVNHNFLQSATNKNTSVLHPAMNFLSAIPALKKKTHHNSLLQCVHVYKLTPHESDRPLNTEIPKIKPVLDEYFNIHEPAKIIKQLLSKYILKIEAADESQLQHAVEISFNGSQKK